MPMYRKKPIVIEARRFDLEESRQVDTDAYDKYGPTSLERWCGGSIRGIRLPVEERTIEIQTLEGVMAARVGDWIIKGLKGEFYPCKPDIFDATYEPA